MLVNQMQELWKGKLPTCTEENNLGLFHGEGIKKGFNFGIKPKGSNSENHAGDFSCIVDAVFLYLLIQACKVRLACKQICKWVVDQMPPQGSSRRRLTRRPLQRIPFVLNRRMDFPNGVSKQQAWKLQLGRPRRVFR